jgi:hypothetical protein
MIVNRWCTGYCTFVLDDSYLSKPVADIINILFIFNNIYGHKSSIFGRIFARESENYVSFYLLMADFATQKRRG